MEPITNEEKYLAALTGESVVLPDPITRKEIYLAAAAGMPVSIPDPITREEMYLSQIKPGDGSGVVIRNQNKTITENGSYKADSGYTGLGTVTVAVPIPEVEETILEPLTVTENGEFTPREGVDGFDKVTVEVENLLSYARSLNNFLRGAEGLPETVEVFAPNATHVEYAFASMPGVKHVILTAGKLANLNYVFNSQYTAEANRTLETVTINANLDEVKEFYQCFYVSTNLREIKGTPLPIVDLSSTNYMNVFYDLSKLEEVRLVPNKLSYNALLTWGQAFSDDTLVSIANAINAAKARTITLHATPKARCAEILGTVSTVTDGDTSYDFFTMDEAGTVTLIEFITTVKGWTLA